MQRQEGTCEDTECDRRDSGTGDENDKVFGESDKEGQD